jgi:hypothetical protein
MKIRMRDRKQCLSRGLREGAEGRSIVAVKRSNHVDLRRLSRPIS